MAARVTPGTFAEDFGRAQTPSAILRPDKKEHYGHPPRQPFQAIHDLSLGVPLSFVEWHSPRMRSPQGSGLSVAHQLVFSIESNSTSKTRTLFGPILPPAPRSP